MLDEQHHMTVVRKGRPKGSRNRRNAEILELAQRLNADPVDFMLHLLSSVTVEVAQTDASGNVLIDANNQPLRKMVAVPLEMKLDAAKAVAPYLYARLQSTQIQGQVDMPVQVHTFPTDAILQNPKLADALSDLALMMAEQECIEKRSEPLPLGIADKLIGD